VYLREIISGRSKVGSQYQFVNRVATQDGMLISKIKCFRIWTGSEISDRHN